MQPLISIIVLTFNRDKYLQRVFECLLAQSYNHFQLIIVNNGSEDKTFEICNTYAKRDQRVHVIHQERQSISQGRNRGLDVATGEYIAFVDDDDIVEPDYIEFLYNLSRENNADISICGSTNNTTSDLLLMDGEEAVIELLWRRRFNMAFPTKLFKYDLFKEERFPNDVKYDDIALMYKLIANANIVAYHGKAKYHFVRHQSNHSAWTTNHSLLTDAILKEYLSAYRTRTLWLSKKFPSNEAIFKYFELSFILSMIEKIERLKIDIKKINKEQLYQFMSQNKYAFLQSPYTKDFEREWVDNYL